MDILKHCNFNSLLAVSILVLSSVSLQAKELLDGQGFDFAGGKLSPEILVKEFHDDNLTSAAGAEIQTFGTLIEPSLTYELKGNKNRITANYLLSGATHYSSHNDDYIDQTFSGDYEYTPTKRISTGFDVEYFKGHDPRGTGAAEGTGVVQSSFDRYDHYQIGANAAYGAQEAKGRFEVDGYFKEKDYNNNFATTAVRDREDIYGSARLFYRVMPKTRMVIEGRVFEVNYDIDAANTASLDSVTYRGLLGVVWDTTYKTTGSAKIGYIAKDFDSGARADGDEFTWELGVEWKPKSYMIFTLDTSRDFSETNGAGDFTQEDKVTGSYTHLWTEKIKTLVNVNYQENTFSADTTGRADDLFSVSANIDFEPRRWLKLGAGYSYDERDSTLNSFDYVRNKVEAYATVVF